MRRLGYRYVSNYLYQKLESRGDDELLARQRYPYREYFHSGLMIYYIR